MYTPERNLNPPSFWEKEIDEELYLTCDLCLEDFLAENIHELGDYRCVCPECVVLNKENIYVK